MRLIAMRHGKAQPDAPEGDFARHLIEAGRVEVTEVGTALLASGERPTRIVVSPSARTRETLEHLPENLKRDAEVTVDETLYNATIPTLLSALEGMSPDETVLMIAHNPGLTGLALLLDRESDGTGLRPADAVVIDVDQLTERGGTRVARHVPSRRS